MCWMLRRTICAMMNTGKTGLVGWQTWIACLPTPGQPCVIYMGLSSGGRIQGVKLGRKERDRLCIEIDKMMKNGFSPSVLYNQYKVYLFS